MEDNLPVKGVVLNRQILSKAMKEIIIELLFHAYAPLSSLGCLKFLQFFQVHLKSSNCGLLI